MDSNTWPDGHRYAMTQDEHRRWNDGHYPGTLQLCSQCGEPTGRCEDDTLYSDDNKPLCELCWPAKGGE